jgi:hypothetical protein
MRKAHEQAITGHTRGKIVLKVAVEDPDRFGSRCSSERED